MTSKVRYIFAVGLTALCLVAARDISIVLADGFIWREVQPVADKNWYVGAMSADGQKILAGASSGRLYLSTNSGGTWSETQPAGAVNKNWYVGDMSADGQKMLAGASSGRLYLSTNGGSSWSETQPAGAVDKAWYSGAMSADGQTILAAVAPGRLYLSTNGGSSWSETQPAGAANRNWKTTSVTADGQVLLVGASFGTSPRLYLSTNSGSSWSEIQPAGDIDANWESGAISDDGQTILVGVYVGRLYLSTNGGSSWSETQPAGAGDQGWMASMMSSNGESMFVATNDRSYVSRDGGATWSSNQLDGFFYSSDMSSDGETAFLGSSSSVLKAYFGTWNFTPVLSALGPDALVGASSSNDPTPTLTFTTTDSDNDPVAYELTIATAPDFSTPVYQATSTYATPGQVSTTTPSLPDGSYYWRVLVGDGNATSSYSTANSGDVAFIINTYVPPPPTTGSRVVRSIEAPVVLTQAPVPAPSLENREALIAELQVELRNLLAQVLALLTEQLKEMGR